MRLKTQGVEGRKGKDAMIVGGACGGRKEADDNTRWPCTGPVTGGLQQDLEGARKEDRIEKKTEMQKETHAASQPMQTSPLSRPSSSIALWSITPVTDSSAAQH
jgi:hypothetical protein